MPAIIGDFRRKYTEARMSITIGSTEDIINDVLSGDMELRIVGGARSKDRKIAQEKLTDDDMRLIVPHDHK